MADERHTELRNRLNPPKDTHSSAWGEALQHTPCFIAHLSNRAWPRIQEGATMQWLKLMGAVPVAIAIAACSSNRSNTDSATSAGVLSDSLGYGVDTNPAKKPGMAMDSSKVTDSLKSDSVQRDSLMKDSAHKPKKAVKKSPKKGG
jgi:hypothetical protein